MTWEELLGLAPFDPARNRPVQLPPGNPGGDIATEYSATTQLPNGRYIVHPQIWWDAQGNPRWLGEDWGQRAAMAYQSHHPGAEFPTFATPEEADAWAAQRSHNGGGTQGSMAFGNALAAILRPQARPVR